MADTETPQIATPVQPHFSWKSYSITIGAIFAVCVPLTHLIFTQIFAEMSPSAERQNAYGWLCVVYAEMDESSPATRQQSPAAAPEQMPMQKSDLSRLMHITRCRDFKGLANIFCIIPSNAPSYPRLCHDIRAIISCNSFARRGRLFPRRFRIRTPACRRSRFLRYRVSTAARAIIMVDTVAGRSAGRYTDAEVAARSVASAHLRYALVDAPVELHGLSDPSGDVRNFLTSFGPAHGHMAAASDAFPFIASHYGSLKDGLPGCDVVDQQRAGLNEHSSKQFFCRA